MSRATTEQARRALAQLTPEERDALFADATEAASGGEPGAEKSARESLTVSLHEEVPLGQNYEGVRIVEDRDWVWLYFDQKPDAELREDLKSYGFRWSKGRSRLHPNGRKQARSVWYKKSAGVPEHIRSGAGAQGSAPPSEPSSAQEQRRATATAPEKARNVTKPTKPKATELSSERVEGNLKLYQDKTLVAKKKFWRISLVQPSRSIATVQSREIAEEAFEALVALGDWSDADVFKSDPERRRKALAIVRAAEAGQPLPQFEELDVKAEPVEIEAEAEPTLIEMGDDGEDTR